MARPVVKLNGAGVQALLSDPSVAAYLRHALEPSLAEARATAPRGPGDDHTHYADSLDITTEQHGKRVVGRLGAHVKHAMAVEAAHGTLSRAFAKRGG